MLLFKRPPQPADFSKKVKSYKKKISDFFSSNNSTSNKPTFAAIWKDFKKYFSKAQCRKCGYCEIKVIAGQNGDVEHFYPKGEIWKLKDDPATHGSEREFLSTVEGRQRDVLSEQGYWWLAYEWSNYLLSCAVCNQYWKLSYFPVAENPRKLPPSKEIAETVLLLNPFDSRDPADHLKFDDMGQIEARTDDNGNLDDYGYETIRTCGLDRESLRDAREEKARKAYYLTAKLDKADSTQQLIEISNDFYSLGDEKYAHAGMVRIIFEDYSGRKWDEFFKKG